MKVVKTGIRVVGHESMKVVKTAIRILKMLASLDFENSNLFVCASILN